MSEIQDLSPDLTFDESLSSIVEHFSKILTSDPPEGISSQPSGAATLLHLILNELQTASNKKQQPVLSCDSSTLKSGSGSLPQFPAEPTYPAPVNPLLRHRSLGGFQTPPEVPARFRRQRARTTEPQRELDKLPAEACGESLQVNSKSDYAVSRRPCTPHPIDHTNNGEELYLEWAERAVENCIRGNERTRFETEAERCEMGTIKQRRSSTAPQQQYHIPEVDEVFGDIQCPRIESISASEGCQVSETRKPPQTPGFSEYLPPHRRHSELSAFVPKIKPRIRGPSVTSLVNTFNNLATTSSLSRMSNQSFVEGIDGREDILLNHTDSDELLPEKEAESETEKRPATSLIDDCLQMLMENPTISYLRNMIFSEGQAVGTEDSTRLKDTTLDIVEQNSQSESGPLGPPDEALKRLEVDYLRDHFNNYLETGGGPANIEELHKSMFPSRY